MNTWRLSVLLLIWLWPVPSAVALAQTQTAMSQDACGGYAKADGEMNEIYRRVLREYAADAQFLRKMRAAQRAWVTYRDAHLAALYPAADPQSQYGSVYTMCRCTALAEATCAPAASESERPPTPQPARPRPGTRLRSSVSDGR